MKKKESQKFCLYYQAKIEKSRCWLVSSLIRGTEHIAFDRCYDVQESIFEFFVPTEMEEVFLEVIEYLKKKEAIITFEKQENRFCDLLKTFNKI